MNNSATEIKSTRDGFGLGLLQAAQLDSRVVGVCADLTESTRMQWFRDQFPERFFEVGVAEQNVIGVSAGLALGGMIPFAASYACFSPANSWGVIRTSVCYGNLNVKIVGGHAGLVTGEDGATHQSLEDIATMRVLPNMTVVVPADGEEARLATLALAQLVGPAYLRTSKATVESTTATGDERLPFEIGKAITLTEGADIGLFACGEMVGVALSVARALAVEKISVRVINMHTIKPLDANAIERARQETSLIVSLEDHQIIGGLGSAIAEQLAELGSHPPLIRLGVNDQFGQSGSASSLLAHYHLDTASVTARLRDAFHQVAT